MCAQLGQSMRRTGGGTAENLSALTPLDQRLVVAVMGNLQFAAGDSHIAISPFPSTVSQVLIKLKFSSFQVIFRFFF